MNNDIELMIEIQEKWQKNLSFKDELLRKKKSIQIWQKELEDLKKSEIELKETVNLLKKDIKSRELILAEKENSMKNLEARKLNIHNERELTAVTRELEKVSTDRDELEEALIELMDDLEGNMKRLKDLENEISEKESQVEGDVKNLRADIDDVLKESKNLEDEIEGLTTDLPVTVKSRFMKIISSKDGVAIARVDGEICGHCNFKIPAHVAQEAGREDSFTTCTNCGRFIYRVI